MTVFTEGNLQISFRGDVTPRRFDDQKVHGLSHCMKAVDFIVEEESRLLFIEFKEPLHPKSTPQQRKEWVDKLYSGKIDDDLKYKYRDTYLYEWACKKIKKPIYYWVLIDLDTLTEVDLNTRTDALKRALPLKGPSSGAWKRLIVEDCAVFNFATWNKYLSDYKVTRLATLNT